ncbi:nuclear transport factor 2 family protein [Aquisediminimonas profunda]|uniref:nuclear transport factor 2 family protein n=1 Tax=Aquisediminimonas profunda TaxID=1550733 RepID=UPI001C62EFFF|nr:nuclear transport factor 2 family protein [Aquisediminimonas profunda]
MKLALLVRGGCIAAAASLLAAPALAADNPQVAAAIMALARAQWAAEIAGKSGAEQNAATADDYTEFNPDYPTRLEGKAMSTAMTDASGHNDVAVFSDMQNAKVQVYGDAAILTYNFVGIRKDASGKTSPNTAKSTRVYAKIGGEWKLVHANFAPISGR